METPTERRLRERNVHLANQKAREASLAVQEATADKKAVTQVLEKKMEDRGREPNPSFISKIKKKVSSKKKDS